MHDFAYLWCVIRWKTLLAALLTFVYPMAASYCLLDNIGLVPPVDCCADTTSHSHEEKAPCRGYGCCPIEYAVYSSLDSGTADLITPPIDVVLFTIVQLTVLPVEVTVLILEHSPPEIPKSWQFSLRTALSPRAPSFTS